MTCRSLLNNNFKLLANCSGIRGRKHPVMWCCGKIITRGGVTRPDATRSYCPHLIVDYFPITTQLKVYYSLHNDNTVNPDKRSENSRT